MFKLPNPPSAKAPASELADFIEYQALTNGAVSKATVLAALGREAENDVVAGIEDEEDAISDDLDDTLLEIERRSKACRIGYPFTLENAATVLRHNPTADEKRAVLYEYFLLSTRLNMKDNRTHDAIDGTHLLEEIGSHALKAYLGNRAQAFVFGTATPGNFKSKVEDLCLKLREGQGFRSLDNVPPTAQDDKVDTVGWLPFSDELGGQVIVFGQCKTGTNWKDEIAKAHPEAFNKRWMAEPFLVTPVRAFCVSEAADRSKWKSTCVEAGVLLDRCRLIDLLDDLPNDLLDQITRWTVAAKASMERKPAAAAGPGKVQRKRNKRLSTPA